MDLNRSLHDFLLNRSFALTEEWYESLDKSESSGVYAAQDAETVKQLKKKNYEFHRYLSQLFILETEEFYQQINEWILKIARDPDHLETPTHDIMREFMRVREQYLDFLNDFITYEDKHISRDLEESWKRKLIEAFDQIMFQVAEEKSTQLNNQIEKQKSVINELSTPLIQLANDRALLPLVGNIDTDRATAILENTLQKCTDQEIDHLFIDLTGVYLVDTMVAHQIFQLIDGLRLIGVVTTVVGIRPEIAQTAVQLGINFSQVKTTATLSQAMAKEYI
ncbi:STAS domain-containing protein [Halobacillus litoralis]|uniref:RsbT co-antagonist protein RsbRB n=1 Tax=Halobacillus litoralis TaxID=45668 RepID=A0A410MB62_9BACI|nr:STAS domain-containing protein [Halobacillus litoralis]QAS51984.1 RsbT co-antagonist protein RsbRB [Halobacillus litoralis]